MKKTFHVILSLVLTICSIPAMAQSSDNGDGTFTNPVLWADLPDPDVIQVDDAFYFVSTSMFMMPGVTILKSYDLVNWSIAANVVPRIDEDPYFDLQGGNRYAHGPCALHQQCQWHVYLLFSHHGGRMAEDGGLQCTL